MFQEVIGVMALLVLGLAMVVLILVMVASIKDL